MRYHPDTLSLYKDLFDDATRMVKEALFGGARKARAAAAEAAAARAAAEEAAAARSAAQKELSELRAQHEALRQSAQAGSDEALLRGRNLWRGVGLGAAAGLPLAAGGAYALGQRQGAGEAETERKKTRNVAFGTGLAAGVVAPHLIRGLGQIARGAGSTGLFPEFQTIGQY